MVIHDNANMLYSIHIAFFFSVIVERVIFFLELTTVFQNCFSSLSRMAEGPPNLLGRFNFCYDNFWTFCMILLNVTTTQNIANEGLKKSNRPIYKCCSLSEPIRIFRTKNNFYVIETRHDSFKSVYKSVLCKSQAERCTEKYQTNFHSF